MEKRYLNIKEVSQILNIPKGTIYNYISAGKIPYLKIGHHVRFSMQVLEEWLKKRQFVPK